MKGGSRDPMGFPHVQRTSCLASSELACVMGHHMGPEIKSCLNSALLITSCGNMGGKKVNHCEFSFLFHNDVIYMMPTKVLGLLWGLKYSVNCS